MRISCAGAAALVLLVLGGCGGGGGGSGSPAPPNLSLSLNPNSLSATLYQGDSQTFQVEGSAKGTVSGEVFIAITDGGGIFMSPITLTQLSATSYIATLDVSRQASVGEHKNAVTVQLCADPGCQQQYTSATVSYDITITSNTNLTPLSSLSGANDWSTVGGNNAHTSYVPVTLNPAQFSSRWLRALLSQSGSGLTLPEVTTSNNIVYFPEATDTQGLFSLDAVSESDGTSVASNTFFGSCASVSGLTLSNGVLFASASGCFMNGQSSFDSYLYAWDANSTTELFHTAYPNPNPNGYRDIALAPIVAGNIVAASGSDVASGTTAFDTGSGASVWQTEGGGTSNTAPASDGTTLFTLGPLSAGANALYLIAQNAASGDVSFSVDLHAPAGAPITPVLTGSNPDAVFAVGSTLMDVNLATQSVRWSVPGSYSQRPAAGNGVVYVLDNLNTNDQSQTQLEARSEADGSLLWTWAAGTPQDNSLGFDSLDAPIVTNNIVFVSTDTAVYAIDLSTHQPVWSYPHPGRLAISANGILYISRQNGRLGISSTQSDGYLAAINLH